MILSASLLISAIQLVRWAKLGLCHQKSAVNVGSVKKKNKKERFELDCIEKERCCSNKTTSEEIILSKYTYLS